MPQFSPIQTAFNSGEWSPRASGRLDLPGYRRALSCCENFKPLPQGSLLMRAGSEHVSLEAEPSRLIPFRLLGAAEDLMLSLTGGSLKVFTQSGRATALGTELLTNGDLQSGLAGWTVVSDQVYVYWGWCYLTYGLSSVTSGRMRQGIAVEAGKTYNVRWEQDTKLILRIGSTPGGSEYFEELRGPTGVGQWYSTQEATFTAAQTGTAYIDFDSNWGTIPGVPRGSGRIRNVHVNEVGAPVALVTPWTTGQVADVQYVAEPAKNKMYFVHPNVAPHVLEYVAPGMWTLTPMAFVAGYPASWAGTNWPGVAELFQGRLYLAATPALPSTVWASRAGNVLDFTTGGADPDDPISFIVSTKGRLRWAQGQRALIAGDDVGERSAMGSGGEIITPGNYAVRDESAFGSAPIQAVSIGDQVVWATRDQRHLRAIDYSLERNGWVSQSITMLGEHLTTGLISEIAFARSPEPVIFARLGNGDLIACTYDRGAEVLAWWRVTVPGAKVNSAQVADCVDGSALWLSVTRGTEHFLEFIPLYETDAQYLDSWHEETVVAVPGDPAHGYVMTAIPNGTVVRAFVDGLLDDDSYTVASGEVIFPSDYIGSTVIVGVPYEAKATTFPLEGGNPGGTMQGRETHYSSLMLRLNDSAPPKLGVAGGDLERVGEGRAFATPFSTSEQRTTGDLGVSNVPLGRESKVDIVQDLPFRTEVCALFGDVQFADL